MIKPSIDELFDQAVALPAGVERDAFVDQTCERWPDLQARLQKLLSAAAQADNFLEKPTEVATHWRQRELSNAIVFEMPSSIGGYQLLKQIGGGGMGIVYLAEQTHPVRRQVALKLIRPGLDSESIIARFEAERQTLALMEHPNIARILDAGKFGVGEFERPFFVMELVTGVSVTAYCDQRRLSIRERLELFATVCQAVHHAHQKGVIHRDLKPSNILVMDCDQVGVPKIIDFGVSKAVNAQLGERAELTAFGAVIGTLEYMSPEQASLKPVDVDTRSDIYSLGAVLYELLAGSSPINLRMAKDTGLLQVLKVIQDAETERPSSRVNSARNLVALAESRRIDANRYQAALRGELDWLVLKAIDHDRERRYETAHDMARDIQRYLAGLPISAAPPVWSYRISKFVRRYAIQTVATVMVLLMLLVAIGGTGWGLWRALQAEAVAKKNLEAAEAARAEEARQRKSAEAIAEFVQYDVLALSTQEGRNRFGGTELPRDTSMREILLRAGKRIAARTTIEPEVAAELHWIVGVSLRAMGEAQQAREILTRSVHFFEQSLGPKAPETLNAVNSLGYANLLAGDFETATALFQRAYDGFVAIYGDQHLNSLYSQNNLARSMREQGNIAEARLILEGLVNDFTRELGPDHNDTLRAKVSLATAEFQSGHPLKSLDLLETAFTEAKSNSDLPRESVDELIVELARVTTYFGQGRRSRELMEPVVERIQQRLGKDHPVALEALAIWANIVELTEGPAAALPLIENSWQANCRILGEHHLETQLALNHLAMALQRTGQLQKAIDCFRQAVAALEKCVGKNHPYVWQVSQNLATALSDAGENKLALDLVNQTIENADSSLDGSHPLLLTLQNCQACILRADGRSQEAVPLLTDAVKKNRERLGWDHPNTLTATINLAVTLRDSGREDQAIEMYQSVIDSKEQLPDSTVGLQLKARNNLAVVYWQQKRWNEAIPLFESTLATLSQPRYANAYPMLQLTARANLGRNYYEVGRLDEAKTLLLAVWRESRASANLKWVEVTLQAIAQESGDKSLQAELDAAQSQLEKSSGT